MSNRTIFYSKKAELRLKKLIENINSLSGMAIEAFETNTAMLLSPVIRKMILEKAKLVDDEMLLLGNFLCCDTLLIKDDNEDSQTRKQSGQT